MKPELFRPSSALWGSRCDEGLRHGDEPSRVFFPFAPSPSRADLARRVAQVRAQTLDRRLLTERLHADHERWQAGPEALRNVEAIADEDAFLVVAGQQPGILGGPLYTLHKIASAVAVARAWNGLGLGTFVPAFWVASDDHDLAEINRLVTQGTQGGKRMWSLALRLSPESQGRDLQVPAHAAVLDGASVSQARKILREGLGLEEGDPRMELFVPREGWTLSDWFARVLLGMFAEEGLVVVEPVRALWPDAGPCFSRLAEAWPRVSKDVAAQAGRMREAGLEVPVEPPQGLPLFELEGPRRRRVERAGPELAERIRKNPARFSPDVLSRVALQNGMLPVAAMVAGPHEASYLPLSWPLHALLGIEPPVVVPRLSATWIDPDQEAFLKRTRLGIEALMAKPRRYEEAVSTLVPPEIQMHLEGVDEAFDSAFTRFAELGSSLDPNLEAPFAKSRERVESEVMRLRRKVMSAAVADAGLGHARWEELTGWILPGGAFQERVYGWVNLLGRHGWEQVRSALAELDPFDFRHHGIRLERIHRPLHHFGGEESGGEADRQAGR